MPKGRPGQVPPFAFLPPTVRTLFEGVFNLRRIELVDEIFADDFRNEMEPHDRSRATLKAIIGRMLDRSPRLMVTVEAALVQGRLVATRERWSGEIMEDGRPIRMWNTSMHQFEVSPNGQISREWYEYGKPRLIGERELPA